MTCYYYFFLRECYFTTNGFATIGCIPVHLDYLQQRRPKYQTYTMIWVPYGQKVTHPKRLFSNSQQKKKGAPEPPWTHRAAALQRRSARAAMDLPRRSPTAEEDGQTGRHERRPE